MWHDMIDRSKLEEVHNIRHGSAIFPMGNSISAVEAKLLRYVFLKETRGCATISKTVGDESGSGHGSS